MANSADVDLGQSMSQAGPQTHKLPVLPRIAKLQQFQRIEQAMAMNGK